MVMPSQLFDFLERRLGGLKRGDSDVVNLSEIATILTSLERAHVGIQLCKRFSVRRGQKILRARRCLFRSGNELRESPCACTGWDLRPDYRDVAPAI